MCTVSDKIDSMFDKMISYECKVQEISQKIDHIKVNDFKKTSESKED